MSKKPIRLYSNPTEVYRLAKKYLGKTIEVLIEKKIGNDYLGKTRTFKDVKIKNPGFLKPSQFIEAKIIKITPWGLKGQVEKSF